MEQQQRVRQWAVDDFNSKHEHQLSSGDFLLGTWVLLQETWLDSQMGNNGPLWWTGPYIVHRKLRDTTYQLCELDGTVMCGSVAANHLKFFYYHEEHQTVRTVNPMEYVLHLTATSSSSSHASVIIGTLNQHLITTPTFPVSVKAGVPVLPDNWALADIPSVSPFAFTSHSLHYCYHPTITELEPFDYNAVQFVRYTASSRIANNHIHENLLEHSNIGDLEVWALSAEFSIETFFVLLVLFCFYETMRASFLNFYLLWKCLMDFSWCPLYFYFEPLFYFSFVLVLSFYLTEFLTKDWEHRVVMFFLGISLPQSLNQEAPIVATIYIMYSWQLPWAIFINYRGWNEMNFHSFMANISFEIFFNCISFSLESISFNISSASAVIWSIQNGHLSKKHVISEWALCHRADCQDDMLST